MQRARRDAGLKVTDRIRLWIGLPTSSAAVAEQWKAHIASQVLAIGIEIAALADGEAQTATTDDIFTAAGELSNGDVIVVRIQHLG